MKFVGTYLLGIGLIIAAVLVAPYKVGQQAIQAYQTKRLEEKS